MYVELSHDEGARAPELHTAYTTGVYVELSQDEGARAPELHAAYATGVYVELSHDEGARAPELRHHTSFPVFEVWPARLPPEVVSANVLNL